MNELQVKKVPFLGTELMAVRLTSDCRNERLPYVLGFLEQGGFEIPKVESAAAPALPTVMVEHTTCAFVNLEDFL